MDPFMKQLMTSDEKQKVHNNVELSYKQTLKKINLFTFDSHVFFEVLKFLKNPVLEFREPSLALLFMQGITPLLAEVKQ